MPKNQQKKKLNVLEQYEANRGSLQFIKANDIQNLAVRIFKDIAFNNIDQKDIDKYQEFFLNKDVIYNLISVANYRMIEEQAHVYGMSLIFKQDPNSQNDQMARTLYDKDFNKFTIYRIIKEAFTALGNTGDLRILYSLSTNLQPFKRYFKLL